VSRWWVSAVNVLQLTSTEDMKMQVRNRLPAALAHVCRYAVTLSDSFGVGDLTSKSESLAKKWIMLTAQVMNGRDVVSCHNEDVNRGPRELVPESDNVISLRHPHGRLLASHYPTEQARVVVHVSSEARFYCLRPQYTEGCRQSPRGHIVERVTVPEHPGQRGHSHVSVVDEPFGVSREGCHNGDLARKSQTVADRLTYAFSKQPNDVRWI
jgi:hypothetical protein